MWPCIIEKAALSYIDTNIGPSTKYHEHARRTVKLKQSPNVFINLENSIGDTFQQAFLSKISKKQCFIELLMRAFSSNGDDIFQRRGDADTSIVSTVLEILRVWENVCFIAAGADLPIMLIYMWNDMTGQIKLKSEGTRKYKESVHDIG